MAATLGVDIGSIAAKAAVHDPRTGVVSFAAERYKERGCVGPRGDARGGRCEIRGSCNRVGCGEVMVGQW